MSKHLTPSLVISLIALAVALGGASYAAIKLPKNSVGTKQLKKKAVTAPKIKKKAVTTSKLKKDAVTSGKLKAGAVQSADLADGSVSSAKVEDGSLLRDDFAAGQITGDAWLASRDDFDLQPVTDEFAAVVTTPVLPAGSYVLAGRANVIAGGSSTLICSLESDAAQNFTVPAGGVFPLSLSAAAVLVEPKSLSLNCSKSLGTPQIAQAHIIATQVNRVTGE